MPTYFDGLGRPLALGSQIGRGGEGAVWEVRDQDAVVKVYHAPIDLTKAGKLKVMSQIATPDLLKVSAWPIGTAHERPSGKCVGIVLPRVSNHREIHELYSPVNRRAHFPTADWEFLLHVAMNCAAAVETVHDAGHVIGDVNPGGLLVSMQGTIRLIDCDSFQIRHGGRMFLCNVGVPEYTPPELQCCSFESVERVQCHDSFGLAVLVFHLLFMGRHPFAGRYLGPGDMPIPKAISEGRFAFGRSASAYQMSLPPHSLPLEAVPQKLRDYFERAFARPASGIVRPTAREWREALRAARTGLTRCANDSAHKYVSHLSACPWCRLEQGGSPVFFASVTTSFDFHAGFDLNAFWVAVLAISEPPDSSALPIQVQTGFIARPVPPDARYWDFGSPQVLPPLKEFVPERLPVIPVFAPEVVPDDSEYRSEPRPQPPSWYQEDPVLRAADLAEAYGSERDFRISKWGTITLAIAVLALLPWPLFAAAAGVFALPFAITWCLGYPAAKRRRKARLLDRRRQEEEYLHAVARWEARDRQRFEAWQRELAALRQRRIELPQREAQRHAEWEEQVKWAKREQVAVEERNTKAYSVWHAQHELVVRQRADIEAHNERIAVARQRFNEEMDSRREVFRTLSLQMEKLKGRWDSESAQFRREFSAVRRKLQLAKARYESLYSDYDRDRNQLSSKQREMQLMDFLKGVLIEDESIPKIKSGRKVVLGSYGIETAWDITEENLAAVTGAGFGPVLRRELLNWRKKVESRFKFNPSQAISPAEQRALKMKYQGSKQAMQAELTQGKQALEAIVRKAREALRHTEAAVKELLPRIGQAAADLTVERHLRQP